MSLELPRLGIGCGTLANSAGEESFEAMISRAKACGFNYFDTAALYLGGESEKRLGMALKNRGFEDAIISTKIGRYKAPGGGLHAQDFYDYSYDRTMRAFEEAAGRLGREHIDIVFIHDLAPRNCGDRYLDLRKQAETGAYVALLELKAQGSIGHIGIATMDWRSCLDFVRHYPVDVIMQAGQYTLLDRDCEPLIDYCGENGMTFAAAAPFNSAILATGVGLGATYNFRPPSAEISERVQKMSTVCRNFGVPLIAAALQFPLYNPGVACVVVGHKLASEVDTNLSYLDLDVPQEMWARLRAI